MNMNVLIIGNGFDLAHKLPTKYCDFLYFCDIVKNSQINWFSGKPVIKTCDINDKDKYILIQLCKNINVEKTDELYTCINENFWIEYFQNKKFLIGEDWINFEEEIKFVTESLYNDYINLKSEFFTVDDISNQLIRKCIKTCENFYSFHIFRELFEKLLEDHKRLITLLEIYMDGYINTIDIETIPYVKNKKINKLLTFNYTTVYTENYDVNVDYCYVHGKANICNNSKERKMVLGYDDHYFSDSKVVKELIPFEKYYQRIVNNTDHNYFEWLKEMENEKENRIYIYGHSLGTSDGDILEKFFLMKRTRIFIYYYSEFDRAEKIKNLAQVLGPDELIRLTGGTDPVIKFEQQ